MGWLRRSDAEVITAWADMLDAIARNLAEALRDGDKAGLRRGWKLLGRVAMIVGSGFLAEPGADAFDYFADAVGIHELVEDIVNRAHVDLDLVVDWVPSPREIEAEASAELGGLTAQAEGRSYPRSYPDEGRTYAPQPAQLIVRQRGNDVYVVNIGPGIATTVRIEPEPGSESAIIMLDSLPESLESGGELRVAIHAATFGNAGPHAIRVTWTDRSITGVNTKVYPVN